MCLFVGGGGGQQQLPKGLEGDEEEEAEGRVLFEKRRERLRAKEKGGKRKNLKDKDWILKKKEVRSPMVILLSNYPLMRAVPYSSTASGGRRTSPATQNTPDASGNPSSRRARPSPHALSRCTRRHTL